MASFFSRLSYSFGNEDWTCDQKALKIEPNDHILCITASGDRPLNLLINECGKIVSVDANPIQNHLLNLKIVAMNHLSHTEFLQFIGATDCNHRDLMYKTLAPFLESNARQYWQQNQKKVRKGVLYQGAIERWCLRLSYLIKLLKGSKNVSTLLGFDNLKEQVKFVERVWNTRLWRKAFDLALRPSLVKPIMKDPGLYENICENITPGNYIYSRMQDALHRGLAKENPLIALILNGKVPPEGFSPCLTKEGTEVIQKRLSRVSTHTQDVVTFLENATPESYDCFSMSDVASYLNPQDYIRMLKAMVKAAKPNARFSLRQFLSGYAIPADLQRHFVRDKALEQDVEMNDRCFVYRYMIGKIEK